MRARRGRGRAGGDEDGARGARPGRRGGAPRGGRGGRGGPGGRGAARAPLRRGGRRPRCPAGRTPRKLDLEGAPRGPCGRAASATRWGSTPRRPEAVARRRKLGRRTARENLADLVDEGTYVEYGPLIFAAQGASALPRGADRPDSRRRPHRGRRGDRRAPVRGDELRLHRPRGDAGDARPPQEGPAVRRHRAPAPAGRALRRGRRRPPGGRGRANGRGPRLPRVQPLRPPLGPRAARGGGLGILLRGQRRAARLLRRGDRDRGLLDRDGRPRDDRGRGARRLPSRGGRPDRRAARQRRRRPARGRRRRRRRGRQAVPLLLPRPRRAVRGARPARAAPRHPRRAQARLRRAPRDRDPLRRGDGAGAASAASAPGC